MFRKYLVNLAVLASLFILSACDSITEKSKGRIAEINPATDNAKASDVTFKCIASQSECSIKTETANYQVKFSQQSLNNNIKSESPFVIELIQETSNSDAISRTPEIAAHIEGKEMFMGKIPVMFSKSEVENAYFADSQLARCHGGEMVWRLWVNVIDGETEQEFFVDFTTED